MRHEGLGIVELMLLYVDYLSIECGALDSDYVFVNLWGRPYGPLLSYPTVYDLVGRLRRRTGVAFAAHMFRYTHATWLLHRNAGRETMEELPGHASITATVDTYGHLSVEDARITFEAAGWVSSAPSAHASRVVDRNANA